jgi:FKBP-type peptidyl-prolyl cis-trans isomerase (trigger factor)
LKSLFLIFTGPHEELEFTLISGTVEYGVTEALEGMKKGFSVT